jgi:SAM-dependent methyltransferase
MPVRWRIRDERPADQIAEHYRVERMLAARLREASKEERGGLYGQLYDELYRQIPHHPQLAKRDSQEHRRRRTVRHVRFLRSLAPGKPIFLEVGAGDCLLASEFSRYADIVYAVDVSTEITKLVNLPSNLRLVLSDGCSIEVPKGTVHLAFSNQLMEHLHPDDAVEQVRNIYRALAPGGRYFCITPNRFSGPHDISRNFDNVATGFHLLEYTVFDLRKIFEQVGFTRFRAYVGLNGVYVRVPMLVVRGTEVALSCCSDGLRKFLGPLAPFRLLLGIRMLAEK